MANLEVRCEVELLEMDYFDTREFTACGPPSALQLQVKWYGPIDSEKVSLEIAGMLTCLSEHEKAWGGLGLVVNPEECRSEQHGSGQTLTLVLRCRDLRDSDVRCDRLVQALKSAALPPTQSVCQEFESTVRAALPLPEATSERSRCESLNYSAQRVAA